MKVLSILLVALFSVFVISCCNQQKVETPEKVITSFEKMFPAATDM